jgi:hypothetical protein
LKLEIEGFSGLNRAASSWPDAFPSTFSASPFVGIDEFHSYRDVLPGWVRMLDFDSIRAVGFRRHPAPGTEALAFEEQSRRTAFPEGGHAAFRRTEDLMR